MYKERNRRNPYERLASDMMELTPYEQELTIQKLSHPEIYLPKQLLTIDKTRILSQEEMLLVYRFCLLLAERLKTLSRIRVNVFYMAFFGCLPGIERDAILLGSQYPNICRMALGHKRMFEEEAVYLVEGAVPAPRIQ